MRSSKLFKPTTKVYNEIMKGLVTRSRQTKDQGPADKCLEFLGIVQSTLEPDARTLLHAIDALTVLRDGSRKQSDVVLDCLALVAKFRNGISYASYA